MEITSGLYFWTLVSVGVTLRDDIPFIFALMSIHKVEVTKLRPHIPVFCKKVLIGFDHQTSLFWTSLEVNSLNGTKASKVYFLIFFFLRWLLMAESCRENEQNKRLVLIRWTWLALQAASPPSQHSNEQSSVRKLKLHQIILSQINSLHRPLLNRIRL